MAWTTNDMPALTGRRAIVTGTGGLGFEIALALASAGADVTLAGRNRSKGEASVERARQASPKGGVEFELLDLANLSSISEFVRNKAVSGNGVHLLINNAGVMALPKRRTTADGFEMQFGTNYLGHFALSVGLLPLLRAAGGARIVTVSSLYARAGAIDFQDLQSSGDYRPQRAYAQSKLADLMFAFELQRRSDQGGWGLLSNAAHPGYARTELIANGPGEGGVVQALSSVLFRPFASQSAAEGALPVLFAATALEARGAAYYGPAGFYELKGPPAPAKIPLRATDLAVAERLWRESKELTGASAM